MAGYEEGDVVGLLLDLDARTLNAEVQELGAGPFCWAVALRWEGDAVRIARGAPPPPPS